MCVRVCILMYLINNVSLSVIMTQYILRGKKHDIFPSYMCVNNALSIS